MVSIEMRYTPNNTDDEVKHNATVLLWGIGILGLILFIPYQAWVLAGSSQGLHGALVMGASLIFSVFICFSTYYFIKGRRLKSRLPSL